MVQKMKHKRRNQQFGELFNTLIFYGVFLFISLFAATRAIATTIEKDSYDIEVGNNLTIKCLAKTKTVIWKCKNKIIATDDHEKYILETHKTENNNTIDGNIDNIDEIESYLIISNVDITDEGVCICESPKSPESPQGDLINRKVFVQPLLSPQITQSSSDRIKQKIGNAVQLFCVIRIYPQTQNLLQKQFKWLKDDNSFDFLDEYSKIQEINSTHVNYTLEMSEVYKKENGSYACILYEANGNERSRRNFVLLVMDVPHVRIDYAKAVGMSRIYLNWTVNDGNDAIQKYFIQYTQEGNQTFAYYKDLIGGGNFSYILENFLPNTSYILRITAKNSIGDGIPHQYPFSIRTLETDPIFIPNVKTTGSTSSTITIGWEPPPPAVLPFIQYYELVVSEAGDVPKVVEEIVYQQNSRNLPYMFDNLKTATVYDFKVRACSDLTKICGPWSDIVNGTTMDGIASKPINLTVVCIYNNISNTNMVDVQWQPPEHPNGKVVSYLINLEGKVAYKLNERLFTETLLPKIRRVDHPHCRTTYEGVQFNTNYTVTVSAITRHRKIGQQAIGECIMPISTPETINRVIWTKVRTDYNKCIFKVHLPKISERNGPICCYRIYLIRMKSLNIELPTIPDKLNVSSYQEVYAANNTIGGIYLAEMLSSNHFQTEIFLGDGKRYFNQDDAYNTQIMDEMCRKCLQRDSSTTTAATTTGTTTTTALNKQPILDKLSQQNIHKNFEFLQSPNGLVEQLYKYNNNQTEITGKIANAAKVQRPNSLNLMNFDGSNNPNDNNNNNNNNNNNLNLKSSFEANNQSDIQSSDSLKVIDEIIDGEIDINSNYTGYLEVIVYSNSSILKAYSDYFEMISPVFSDEQKGSENLAIMLNIVIQVLAILFGIVLILLLVLCCLYHSSSKSTTSGEEVISLRGSLSRVLFGSHSNNHRHFIGSVNGKIADVGPIPKSDLNTAYKNRHKDTDYGFLREYEMLPNRFSDRTTKNSDLKENATKNRYPDIKAYDQTRVKLAQITSITGSDYINANFVIGYKERKKFICAQGPMESTLNDFWRMIWEQHLEIIIMLTNLEEYNKTKCAKYWPEKVHDGKQYDEITVKFMAEIKYGDYLIRILDIFKRNSMNSDEEESRQITQYHYLVWKDFMAPEYPHGLIKFIRHINEVYSVQRGPILVHCSAGVGRTGTLVALDSLLQQLEEEEQVSIFNTVCDLRHQRNFLVQSLKQYTFLYRALLDVAQFGNTELSAIGLSATTEKLKLKSEDSRDKCKLRIEFEKLQSINDEINKACTIGSSDENSMKNRCEFVIPYDRNRVILSPLPHKDNSTYINASFIEGYDNSENYIITQDPLENTMEDFWRMISEQSVTTIVMLSEIGDGLRKCPRYWADDEVQFDHILVKYLQSESCPYYTRREFNVTNCKINDTIKVTQFQYNGWPTVDGEVPEVCRGIIELVDQAMKHHSKENSTGCKSPITIHCSLGTDRCSIFVAMCILVQQLRTEKVIDICSTARKIRSQRSKLIDSYAQYEFLHRAIANYADLHKLSSE